MRTYDNPPSTPPEDKQQPQNPDESQPNPEVSLSQEKIEEIEKALGHEAFILTTMSKEARQNVITEAVDLKTKEAIDGNKTLSRVTRIPLVGRAIKAGVAASRRAEVVDAFRTQGDFSQEAFDKLGLDAKDFNTINSANPADSIERAQHILEHGYRDEKTGVVTSKLDSNERVKEVKDASATDVKVKGILNDYYALIKTAQAEGKSEAEISKMCQEYEAKLPEQLGQGSASKGERIASTIVGEIGKQDSISVASVKQAMDRVRNLAKSQGVTAEDFKKYTENMKLHLATTNESINTEKKVDNITKAIVAGGVAGAVLYIAGGRGARTGIRGFVQQHTALSQSAAGGVTAGITGAIVGGAAGLISGAMKASEKASIAEAKDIGAMRRGEEASQQATAEGTPNKPKGAKQNALAIIGKMEAFKRKLTKEESTLGKINELRGRKTADSLIKELDEAMSDLASRELLEGDGKANLEARYAEIIARARFSSEKRVDLIVYSDDKGKLEKKLLEAEETIYSGAEGDDRKAIDARISAEVAKQTEAFAKNDIEARKLRAQYIARSAAVEAIAGAAIGAAAGGIFYAAAPHVHALFDKIKAIPAPVAATAKASDIFHTETTETSGALSYSAPEGAETGELPPSSLGANEFEDNPVQIEDSADTMEDGIKDGGEFPEGENSATVAETITAQETATGNSIAKITEQLKEKFNSLTNSENTDITTDVNGDHHINIGDKKLTYDFKSDGTLSDTAKNTFEQAGIEINEYNYEYTLDGKGITQVNREDFFDPQNAGEYGLTTVEHVGYNPDNSYVLQGTSVDAEGNTVLNIRGDNFEGKQILFSLTPAAGTAEPSISGIALDINPDGTVNLEGTSAESLFDQNGDLKAGFRYQLIENNGDNTTIYQSVVGNSTIGENTYINVPVDNPSGNLAVTTAKEIGSDVSHNITPDSNFAKSTIEARNGWLTNKFGIEPTGSSGTLEVPGVVATLDDGETSVNLIRHYGGYNPDYDSYFGPKVDPNNLGQSLAQTMLSENGTDISNMSAPQIEAEFLEQLNSGTIDKGEAIETYLRTLTNSPESMVLNRFLTDASFHDELDLDGDGVITQQDINEYANQLITNPSAYDDFANKTIDAYMKSIEGKDVEFFNYADENEHYNVSTWAKNEGGDVRLRTGHIIDPSKHSYYGVGMRFVDEDGNSNFLEDRVHSLYGDKVDVARVGSRTTCGGQITGQEGSTPPAATSSTPGTTTPPPSDTTTPSAKGPVIPPADNPTPPADNPTPPADNPPTPPSKDIVNPPADIPPTPPSKETITIVPPSDNPPTPPDGDTVTPTDDEELIPAPKDQMEANENSGANEGIVVPESQTRPITAEPEASTTHPYNPDKNTYNYTPEEQAEETGYKVENDITQVGQESAPVTAPEQQAAAEEMVANKTAPEMVPGTSEGATGSSGTANNFDAGATTGTGGTTGGSPSADGSGRTIQENLNTATGVEGADYNEGF